MRKGQAPTLLVTPFLPLLGKLASLTTGLSAWVPFSSGTPPHEFQRHLEDIYFLVFKCHIPSLATQTSQAEHSAPRVLNPFHHSVPSVDSAPTVWPGAFLLLLLLWLKAHHTWHQPYSQHMEWSWPSLGACYPL